MSTKLHDILAVEKTKTTAIEKLFKDTHKKFNKPKFFVGSTKSLTLFEDHPSNKSIEDSSYEYKHLSTTVHETLEHIFKYWADTEDVIFQKNVTNQGAIADLTFHGVVIEHKVPVSELIGLTNRLTLLKEIMEKIPTLSSSVQWMPSDTSDRKGTWVSSPEMVTKTEKTTIPVVLHEATNKHPAQIKELTSHKPVGTFKITKISGAATKEQKAKMLAILDELLTEIGQAIMRANSIEASTRKIGESLVDLILSPLRE